MYVDLADKLITHFFELWKLRRDTQKEVFENSIEILFNEFEKIHGEYLVIFREYRSMLVERKIDFAEIIEKIYQERTFSQANRSKLIELTKALENNVDDDFYNFYKLLLNYLTATQSTKENLNERNMGLTQRWLKTVMEFMNAIEKQPLNLSASNIDWDLICSIPMLRHLNEKRFEIFFDNSKMDKYRIAVQVLDVILETMQQEYRKICQEYARLRVKYLR